MMILYHRTAKQNIQSILIGGLKPNKIGIVYLTPAPDKTKSFGDVLLKVDTGDLRLTAFEDCSDWEVLCWGHILPKNITILMN